MEFIDILKKIFRRPSKINWGYPFFFMAVGTGLIFLIDRVMTAGGGGISLTSITGYSLITLLLSISALVLPAAVIYQKRPRRLTGSYTGIGILLMSLLSGAPFMLITTVLRNFCIWVWLKLGNNLIYPAFFYVYEGDDRLVSILSFLSETIIPSFAIAFFFFGAMQGGIRRIKPDKWTGCFIVAFAFALFKLDFFSFLGYFFVGIWLYYLRDRADNIFAPFSCLVGINLTKSIMGQVIKELDLTTLQTYSDISKPYFYAIIPAIMLAIPMILFFIRYIDEGYKVRTGSRLLTDSDKELFDHLNQVELKEAPELKYGFNLPCILGIIIYIILWTLLLKGY